jgi:hypothetical protein
MINTHKVLVKDVDLTEVTRRLLLLLEEEKEPSIEIIYFCIYKNKDVAVCSIFETNPGSLFVACGTPVVQIFRNDLENTIIPMLLQRQRQKNVIKIKIV